MTASGSSDPPGTSTSGQGSAKSNASKENAAQARAEKDAREQKELDLGAQRIIIITPRIIAGVDIAALLT
jgi:hypothetical protein